MYFKAHYYSPPLYSLSPSLHPLSLAISFESEQLTYVSVASENLNMLIIIPYHVCRAHIRTHDPHAYLRTHVRTLMIRTCNTRHSINYQTTISCAMHTKVSMHVRTNVCTACTSGVCVCARATWAFTQTRTHSFLYGL